MSRTAVPFRVYVLYVYSLSLRPGLNR
jgi:hypothetical protein